MSSWYSIDLVRPNLYHIGDKGHDSIWLLVGSQKALLIDTGWGVPGLKEAVSGLTSLPVIVANSHGHPDHCRGNYLFGQVHVHPDDAWMANYPCKDDAEARYHLTQALGAIPADLDVTKWGRCETNLCAFPEEPMDLGGVSIQVIHTPGHTKGSVSFFVPEWRALMVGDTVTLGPVLLLFEESADLHTYKQSLQKLAALRPEVDALYWGHGKDPMNPGRIHQFIRCIEQAESGKLAGRDAEVFGVRGVQYMLDEYTGIIAKRPSHAQEAKESSNANRASANPENGKFLTGVDAKPYEQAVSAHLPGRTVLSVKDRGEWIRRNVEVTLDGNEVVFFKIELLHEGPGWLQCRDDECHERDVIQILKPHGLDHVIPPVLAVDHSRKILPYLYIIQAHVGGIRLGNLIYTATGTEADAIYETLGQFYRRLHSVHNDIPGPWTGSTPDKPLGDPTGYMYQAEIVGGSGKRALEQGRITQSAYDRAVTLWKNNLEYMKDFQPILVHGSAFPWTIYLDYDSAGWRITKLTAVNDMLWWEPAYDLAALKYPPFADASQVRWDAFLRGYGPAPEKKRVLLFAIMQRLCAAMGCYCEPKSPQNEDWAREALESLGVLLDSVDSSE